MSTLPAGKYYIGDPCYTIDNDKWMELLELFRDAGERGGIFEFEGHPCAAFYTRWGDGQYQIQPTGDFLPVDAGMIGMIPAALVTDDYDGGIEIDVFGETECYEEDGTLTFGTYVIKTGDDDEEDIC